jgi:D-alanyl-D-alanine dipeptidase
MKIIKIIVLFVYVTCISNIYALPPGFVYLKTVDPSILQDMRYAGYHNFIGKPIVGYESGECILTRAAATALAKVQAELKKSNLSLKVYDCYRPQMAVNEFIRWSKKPNDQQMKMEFYPNVNKIDFFRLGYAAQKSEHSHGSTVDLTLVAIPTPPSADYHSGDKLVSCFAAYGKRFGDNSIDMGTGFDCMDPRSFSASRAVSQIAHANRMQLRHIMQQYGFSPYGKEWWHFTLKNEPFPSTYFNFPVK